MRRSIAVEQAKRYLACSVENPHPVNSNQVGQIAVKWVAVTLQNNINML